jgi:hypothetical protein
MKRSKIPESNPKLSQRDFILPRQIHTPPTSAQLAVDNIGELARRNWNVGWVDEGRAAGRPLMPKVLVPVARLLREVCKAGTVSDGLARWKPRKTVLTIANATTTARTKEARDIGEKDGSADKYFIPNGRK